jgi:hypothetical protein
MQFNGKHFIILFSNMISYATTYLWFCAVMELVMQQHICGSVQ